MAFKGKEVEGVNSTKRVFLSLKAISVHAVSPRKFLILDSAGDIHMLHVSVIGAGSNITGQMMLLPHFMNVQKIAVLPDISLSMLLCIVF